MTIISHLKIGSHEEVNFGLFETVWGDSWINKTSFVPYLDFLSAKFKDSCFNLLRYVTKISPLANSCIAKYVLVANACAVSMFDHILGCYCHSIVVATVQTFAIYNSPSSLLAQKKSPSQNFHQLCCFIHQLFHTLATSHTWIKNGWSQSPLLLNHWMSP
jgi:hypothetical protein